MKIIIGTVKGGCRLWGARILESSRKQSCIIAKKIIAITIQIQLCSKKIPITIKITINLKK